MTGEKRVLFFCSANSDIDPKYGQAAREIVRAAVSRGYTIVSGGTTKGMMNVIGEEAERCGGRHIGVLPHFMEPLRYPGLSETVWADTMSARKEAMRAGAGLVIALPGGIGTLDELFETLVLVKLGRYHARVAALNLGGFYDPLEALLSHLVRSGMLAPRDKAILQLPESVEEVLAML
ncbi:MAG: TIGR00730 family Rossman fold protein [Bacteroidales bacterium]|nr:TIGR00730 family Rossman fold protein [Bacteroidales bacterium]